MGWTIQKLTPEIIALMNPEDQEKYAPGQLAGIHPNTYQEDDNPPNKTDTLERVEQKDFANWCLSHGYVFIWHATHKKSTATTGCPDFIVVARSRVFFIEFKSPGKDLSKGQKIFRAILEQNGMPYFVAYSSHEAMKIVDPSVR